MKHPLVSICMPNLNGIRYLPERLESIIHQTLTDWELVVVDGYSDDGGWEFLVELAEREKRVRLSQASRGGIYEALNRCVRLARGKYVYIAPSDDVMALDCLDRLAVALEAEATCGLAHCPLRAIGEGAVSLNKWWTRSSVFAISSRGLLNTTHIRRPPFDGLLHLNGETVYTSLTQLLIRRSLFELVGPFDERWGSIGDFNWAMRATLATSTVHVPDTWGGWRLHSEQSTRAVGVGSYEHRRMVEEMTNDAIERSWANIPKPIRQGLREWRRYFVSRQYLQHELQLRLGRSAKVAYLARELALGSEAARSYILMRASGKKNWTRSAAEVVEAWLRSVDDTEYLIPA